MEALFLVLSLVVSLLLIGVVLIQPGKADMISGMGGLGGQMTNLIGVRQSRNMLQNLTLGFAAFLIVAAIVVNKFFMETGGTVEARSAVEGAAVPNVERTTQQPAAPAPGQQQAAPAQQEAAPASGQQPAQP